MKKAAATRMTILQKAFELIYTKGYQTTSVDEIIATTMVTKGAFYYHFKNKEEMGLAVVSEIIKPTMVKNFIKPLKESLDSLDTVYEMIKYLLFEDPLLKLEYGCPAGNLTQEMTPWNTAFGGILSSLVSEWQTTIEQGIEHGKENGIVRPEVNSRQVACFIMSGYWGVRNIGKVYNSNESYEHYLKELEFYLKSLKTKI